MYRDTRVEYRTALLTSSTSSTLLTTTSAILSALLMSVIAAERMGEGGKAGVFTEHTNTHPHTHTHWEGGRGKQFRLAEGREARSDVGAGLFATLFFPPLLQLLPQKSLPLPILLSTFDPICVVFVLAFG